jgi:predicted glycoside hydrolase/deacetylase ChbG (UPF0249 family)
VTRLLIVTADDLGLTRGVNAAVRRAHEDGIVTATSLLAVGREFDDAAAMLRDVPTLELGAHLALVGEDPPLLSAREIPTAWSCDAAWPGVSIPTTCAASSLLSYSASWAWGSP